MCERIFPRSGRRCPKPITHHLTVEMTGEVVGLCYDCALHYDNGGDITYAPRRPTYEPIHPYPPYDEG